MPSAEVIFTAAAVESIRAHAAETYPEECCGILVGRDSGGVRHVARAERAANVAAERKVDRYVVDPRAILAAERAGGELEVVGFYHSHPDHPAEPSSTDLAAAWPVYTYAIVSVRAKVCGELRVFRLRDSRAVEDRVRIEG